MARCLVVANQTLGGRALERELRGRIDRGDAFHVVVPMTAPEHESSLWSAGVPEFQVPATVPPGDASTVEEARRRSEHRLRTILDRIHQWGGRADGEVGSTDPLEAAMVALERERFDEVVVSTLPARLSRWLRMDLPSRLQRATDVPVVTVEAED